MSLDPKRLMPNRTNAVFSTWDRGRVGLVAMKVV